MLPYTTRNEQDVEGVYMYGCSEVWFYEVLCPFLKHRGKKIIEMMLKCKCSRRLALAQNLKSNILFIHFGKKEKKNKNQQRFHS